MASLLQPFSELQSTNMHFSIQSLLGLSLLSLLASTCHARPDLTRSLITNVSFTTDIVEINQLYNLLGLCIDDKALNECFPYIFTEDVAYNTPRDRYSTLPVLIERSRIQLANRTTLYTPVNLFVFDITSTTAKVVTDLVVTYFGTRNLTTTLANTYTRFNDTLVKRGGLWKISSRTVMSDVSLYSNGIRWNTER